MILAALVVIANVSAAQPQLAAAPGVVAVTFGEGESIWFAASHDDGQSFSAPKQVERVPGLNLGMHRGPRIAITPRAMVISAVNGKTDGNLLAWRSYDGGSTWTGPVTVNDKPKAASEGLQAMGASPGGLLYSVWLDHRIEQPGKQLYGAYSTDDGKTWSKNILIYQSPSGTICQCCHPSLTFGANGDLHVMFRNAIEGNRDLYVTTSRDGGKTFGLAAKQGTGSWKLEGCPMDGGGIATDGEGRLVTAWRRQDSVYLFGPGTAEMQIARGKNPAVAADRQGVYVIWSGADGIEARVPNTEKPVVLDSEGGFPQLIALPNGRVLAAWERKGTLQFRVLP